MKNPLPYFLGFISLVPLILLANPPSPQIEGSYDVEATCGDNLTAIEHDNHDGPIFFNKQHIHLKLDGKYVLTDGTVEEEGVDGAQNIYIEGKDPTWTPNYSHTLVWEKVGDAVVDNYENDANNDGDNLLDVAVSIDIDECNNICKPNGPNWPFKEKGV